MNTLKQMMETQSRVNILTRGDDWYEQGLDWRLAISQETAELIDSFDWKWWKKMSVDTENAEIEIVDIWHFVLSLMIEEGIEPDDMLEEKFNTLTKTEEVSIVTSRSEIIKHCKNINKVTANNRPALDIADATLMTAGKIGMSFEHITKLYMGKAVLNNFRQENGYAKGTYLKMWNDKEDNMVMLEIISILPYDNNFEADLSSQLTERYMLVE